MRARWQRMTPEQRAAEVAKRDKKKVRAADRARYDRDKEKRLKASADYQAQHPEEVLGAKRRWVKRNPEKREAHLAVARALRSGQLVKGPCAHAEEGVACSTRIEGHHDDYTRPLDVTWLCAWHHAELRRLERQ